MDKNFIFRRQFILSSNPEFNFDFWQNLTLDENIFISVHPEMGLTQSFLGDVKLTLLGFAINPLEPEQDNQQVLNAILKGATNFEQVLRNTEPISGRWIIIYQDKTTFKIFHDPCGNRQVYYYKGDTIDLLCGSDPAIFKHFMPLEDNITPEIDSILNNPIYKLKENGWIGPETLFKNVLHLMPNYYLDAKILETVRFWPYKPMGNLSLDEASDLSARLLKGAVVGLSKRTKIALAVTAGWDSRVLLAASKDIKNDVRYFVSVMGGQSDDFHEVRVPKKLMKLLNLPFYIQHTNQDIEPEFKKMLESNISNARTFLPKARSIYKYHQDFSGLVSVNGNVSEIGRICIRPFRPQALTGENIAAFEYFSYGGAYFAKQFDLWIDELNPLCEAYNINIYDMLYWEQRMGNWGAQYPAEQDVAIDQLSPFNNRMLLTTMLSLDEKYRNYPDYILHYEMIKKLWPETLQVQVGVVPFKNRIKLDLKNILSGILHKFASRN